ncbi:DUF3152 domain-containing protein [Streptomyces sp. NPDC006879]|uniref:DUF3152 domain-containing protein n=1 Tax=Streptomyces sp. NPDC006879 TaxID=3364767 RepID=UPI003688B5C4
MGRHSRKGPVPEPGPAPVAPQQPGPSEYPTAGPGGYAGHDPYDTGRQSARLAPYGQGGGYPQDTTGAIPVVDGWVEPVRGGHPEIREPGGGWGTVAETPSGDVGSVYGDWRGTPVRAPSAPAPFPRPRRESPPPPAPESVAAFDSAFAEPAAVPGPRAPVESGVPARSRGRGRLYTGMAAAAVTTVLAVVVAQQVASEEEGRLSAQSSNAGEGRTDGGLTSRSDQRTASEEAQLGTAPVEKTYEEKLAESSSIDPGLKGSGRFEVVPGFVAAPGKGRLVRYRVEVEENLGLDAALFAEAVQRTLNDERGWAHGGKLTFERVSSGAAEFVITLASPGTTAHWCAKSGLDTTVDNVSCDSSATERVMINGFRWAQGSETYGPQIAAYRQMLINHEIGHRLGHGHVNCSTPGALAPVMQQQTKSLEIGGIKCRPNQWVYPGN